MESDVGVQSTNTVSRVKAFQMLLELLEDPGTTDQALEDMLNAAYIDGLENFVVRPTTLDDETEHDLRIALGKENRKLEAHALILEHMADSSLVGRLRAEVDPDVNEPLDRLLEEAADEIQRLQGLQNGDEA